MREVFLIFLRLGLTSFGGPVAHLGYFRREFVERQRWLDERVFTQVVAFCSILPGPTSSQVGLIVGLLRAGPLGAFAAWLGFTLPSAIALAVFAFIVTSFTKASTHGSPHWFVGLLDGLSAAATAIVAGAVVAMSRTQCPDSPTRWIAAGAAALSVALAAHGGAQWLPIASGALAGALVFRRRQAGQTEPSTPVKLPRGVAVVAAVLFAALIAVTSLAAGESRAGLLIATIVRAGSLVFGGGHVVLPLLAALVPAGLISDRDFSAGYGATGAIPGPLFTFAAFLGSANTSPIHGPLGAAVATVLIFLPSFLLVFALLPAFGTLLRNRAAAGALRGANAAVVGVLGTFLLMLIGTLGGSSWRITTALAAFVLVTLWHVPPWMAVTAAGGMGILAAAAGFAL